MNEVELGYYLLWFAYVLLEAEQSYCLSDTVDSRTIILINLQFGKDLKTLKINGIDIPLIATPIARFQSDRHGFGVESGWVNLPCYRT
jgi:hypothetical protein